MGLHVYPLAYAFRLPVYYATATLTTVLAVAAIACMALAPALATRRVWEMVVGLGSGLVLWGTCAYIWLPVREELTRSAVPRA